MNKTKPEVITQAITLIAQGYSNIDVARKCKLNEDTIGKYRIDYITEISEIKKSLQSKLVESAADQLAALATDMLKGSKLAMDLVIDKIKEASPAQGAVILGILQDKYNLILGNPSVNIAVKFQGRDDMLGYIKSGIKPVAMPAQKPIVDIEPIEVIPKPIKQIANEANLNNRIAARRRGRPRIHPLPDPSIPKRGRGRPRKKSRLPIIPDEPIIPDMPVIEAPDNQII